MAVISLQEFLRLHCLGPEIVPRSDGEEWHGLIARMSIPGRVCEIDEEAYEWFLECLPPKTMFRGGYAFAEGAEPIRLFWKHQTHFFTRQLNWPETTEFCRLAGISLPH